MIRMKSSTRTVPIVGVIIIRKDKTVGENLGNYIQVQTRKLVIKAYGDIKYTEQKLTPG